MVKDTLREIKRKWFQFTALIVITALGVGFFIGIRVTGYDMRNTMRDYEVTRRMPTLELQSSLGVDEAMLDELETLLGYNVSGLISTDVLVGMDVIKLFQYDENNREELTLVSGRLPRNAGELVMDSAMMASGDYAIGDVLIVEENDLLPQQELHITGFVESVLFLDRNRGTTQLHTGNIRAFAYAMELERKNDLYTAVRIDAPVAELDSLVIKLEEHETALQGHRFDRAVAPDIAKLEDAQRSLDKNRNEALNALSNAQSDLDKAKQDLNQAEKEIRQGLETIYGSGLSGTLNDNYTKVSVFVEQKKRDAQTEFAKQQALIDMIPDPVQQAYAQAQLDEAMAQAAREFTMLENSMNQLGAGITQWEAGMIAQREGQSQLNSQRRDTMAELAKAQADIDAAYQEIADADRGTLYIRTRNDIVLGYQSFHDDSYRIEGIGEVFPLIFFGVAILVTLSTVTRMIDESRTQIGIYKAMGYHWFYTSMKFIGFSFFAWLIGSLLGILLGFVMIPNIIYNAYRIMYLTPDMIQNMNFSYAWVPLLLSFASCVLVTILKALRITRDSAANLMRPLAPKRGSKVLLEYIPFIWMRMSFLYKVSIRNLFRNKTRVLMTLVGIGGCMGLLVTGFGIRGSINNIFPKQFEELLHYDALLVFEDDFDILDTMTSTVILQSEKVDTENMKGVSLFVIEDMKAFSEMITFRNRTTQEVFTPAQDSVVVTEKLALLNNWQLGDEVSYTLDNESYTFNIGAITENYIMHYIYMPKDVYHQISGQEFTPNMAFFNFDVSQDTVAKELLQQDNILAVQFMSDIEETQREVMGNFDVVIAVVVLAAFALELIVLMNLITMNMAERYKELATLKVLGFYPNELASYLLRENMILSLISVLLGCVFGYYLHQFVIISAEIDAVMFSRSLDLISYLAALVLTLLLSLLINLFMARKANRVNMSEALKTFDE